MKWITHHNFKEGNRFWLNGRIRLGGYDRRGSASIEYTVPCSHCGWSVTFGGGDSGRNLGLTLAIPFLITVFATFKNVFPRRPFARDFDQGDDRTIEVYFHENAIWWNFWVGTMASWSSDYPWCKKWRHGNFNFGSLLGPMKYSCETLREDIPVEVPMPEGIYSGSARIERRTWKRPLWAARVRVSTWIEVPGGIPFQGKGENSWDCGDDGLFGAGFEGESVERAVQHFRDTVINDRKRYGNPSAESIRRALDYTGGLPA